MEVPSEINVEESFFIHYEYDSTQAYFPGFTSDSPYPEEKKKEPEASKKSGPDIQDHNYNFEKPNSEYTIAWNTGKPSINVADGKLRVMADKESLNWALHLSTPFYPTSENIPFDLRIKGEVIEGNGSFGVVFGVKGKLRTFFDFIVDPKRHAYLWSYFNEGTFKRESDWISEPTIINEGTNRLRVQMSRNKQASLYINGQQVETLKLESYKGGGVGIIVNAFNESAVAAFEYFKLKTYQY